MDPYHKPQPLVAEDEERLDRSLRRVQTTGGLPMKEKQRKCYMGWLRTLTRRGHLQESFLLDDDAINQTFKIYFPNPVSRAQYLRAILMYLSGLTSDEWQAQYPQLVLERERVILSLKSHITSANKERKSNSNAANATPGEKNPGDSSILS